MLRLFLLVVIPTILALILCALVGNAIPAIVVGGVCLVLLVLGIIAAAKDTGQMSDGGFLALGLLVVIPSAINTILLLGGSGVYYLSRYLGG